MAWQPWFKVIIIAIIIAVVKSFQQSTSKKITLESNSADTNNIIDPKIQDESKVINSVEENISVYEMILKIIDDMGYILISKNIKSNLHFEIEFVNYERKWTDFKRQPTYVKLNGYEKSKNVLYTTWSDRYEFGQNYHNNKIARRFLLLLEERL